MGDHKTPEEELAEDLLAGCDEIEKGLYLGSLTAATDVELIKSLRISHILTVDTQPLPTSITESGLCEHMYIQADDRPNVDLLTRFPEAMDFIKSGQLKGSVLVHCVFGVSRSATITVGYLMHKNGYRVEDAISFIKTKRVIGPNPGFLAQLNLFEQMGNKIDERNPRYQLYKATVVQAAFKRGIFGFVEKKYVVPENMFVDGPTYNSESTTRVIYKCQKCRKLLFLGDQLIPHAVGERPTWYRPLPKDRFCSDELWIVPMRWMTQAYTQQSGKITCPSCNGKIGNYSWSGVNCGCGAKISPAFHIHKGKVDECMMEYVPPEMCLPRYNPDRKMSVDVQLDDDET